MTVRSLRVSSGETEASSRDDCGNGRDGGSWGGSTDTSGGGPERTSGGEGVGSQVPSLGRDRWRRGQTQTCLTLAGLLGRRGGSGV